MRIQVPTNDEPVPTPRVPTPGSVPMPAPAPVVPVPAPTLPAVVIGKQPDSSYEEPPVLLLQDSKFVRLSSKEVKNLKLPQYLQLELDFSPLKEGETISADRNSSIRHAGKP